MFIKMNKGYYKISFIEMNTTMEPTITVEKYIESMTEKEKQAYQIAKEHLGSLFTIEKTNGYLQWIEKQREFPTGEAL